MPLSQKEGSIAIIMQSIKSKKVKKMKKITCPYCRETNFYLLASTFAELFYGHNKFGLVWYWIKDLVLRPKIIKELRKFMQKQNNNEVANK